MKDAELTATISTMSKKVDDIHEVIYGNGDTDSSLVVRFALVEAFTKDAKKLVWISVGAALTAVVGMLIALTT